MVHLSQLRSTAAAARVLAGTLAVLLTTVALWGAVATAAAPAGQAAAPAGQAAIADVQADEPSLRIVGGPVAKGEATTVSVVLTAAPDGLAGYYLDVSVVGDGARIASAGYPDAFGLTTAPDVGPDNRTVTLEAADLDSAVEPGATNVTIATVTVVGMAPGEVEFAVEPRQFDGDRGGAFDPQSRPGSLPVTGPDGQTVAASAPATSTAAADESDADTGTSAPDQNNAGSASTDAASTESDESPRSTTSGDGPLSTPGTLVAIAAGTAVALRRHRQ